MRPDSDLSVRWHAGAFNNGLIFGATYHGVTRMPRRVELRHRTRRARGSRTAACATARARDRQPARRAPGRLRTELRRLALLTYRSYACDTIDFIRSLSMDRAQFAPMIAQLDSHRFDELLAEGRGVILVGGHFGNWELGGVALRLLRGYPLTVVGKPEASPAVAGFRHRMRESLGIETLEIGQMLETALQIRRVLAANSIVAMLLDRHLGKDRVEVTFFNRPTPFLRTPAMIAYLSGAPLLPSFMIRQPDGRFLGVCSEPIRVDASLPAEESVRAATQAFAIELERRIRAHPHLWYQFYRYWDSEAAMTHVETAEAQRHGHRRRAGAQGTPQTFTGKILRHKRSHASRGSAILCGLRALRGLCVTSGRRACVVLSGSYRRTSASVTSPAATRTPSAVTYPSILTTPPMRPTTWATASSTACGRAALGNLKLPNAATRRPGLAWTAPSRRGPRTRQGRRSARAARRARSPDDRIAGKVALKIPVVGPRDTARAGGLPGDQIDQLLDEPHRRPVGQKIDCRRGHSIGFSRRVAASWPVRRRIE